MRVGTNRVREDQVTGRYAGQVSQAVGRRAANLRAKVANVRNNRRASTLRNRTATFDRVSKKGRRNQMVTGRIKINGRTYRFRSGGFGRGNLPKGDYTIKPHLWSRKTPGMTVGGVGYSFAMSNKYDPRVGATRKLLRIHPDGRGPGTEGCVGIVGGPAVQRRFREDMRKELKRNGGRFTLRIR